MNLTQHFTLDELTASGVAARLGIDNSATMLVIDHLKVLAQGLEEVRDLLGAPIHINSGYRCSKLNLAIGGSSTSAHMSGFAADFVSPIFGDPTHVFEAIRASKIQFDQLILEFGQWVHISFAPAMRGEVLVASRINGAKSVSYAKG